MSKVLYSQSTEQIKPYPRKDNAEVVGLDPDYLVLDKTEGAIPTYDPQTESISPNWVINLENFEYRQEWVVNPRELQPNWDGFNGYILSDTQFNIYYGTGLGTAPAVTASLPAALAQVASNGVAAFAMVFNGFCAAAGVTPTHRGEWADEAVAKHLPTDFVAVIRGS